MNPSIAQPIPPSQPISRLSTKFRTRIAGYLGALVLLLVSLNAFAQRILPDDPERPYAEAARRKLDVQAQKIWKLKEVKSDDKTYFKSPPFLRLEKDYRAANQQYTHFVAYDDRKKLHLDVALAVVDADLADAN